MLFRVLTAFALLCSARAEDNCPEDKDSAPKLSKDRHAGTAAASEGDEGATPNRAWRLRSRPVGTIADTDLELVNEFLPRPAEGQLLIKTEYISLDPTHRIWMSDKAQYMPPVNLGEVMRAASIGVVEVSRNAEYPVGTHVVAFGGVQERFIGIPGVNVLYEAGKSGLPLTADLSAASIVIGLTAWHGMVKVLAPEDGDIVVVSGAAGAVGSIAGQLAKVRGATVIGLAGSKEKCEWMKQALGFDVAINYKTEDVHSAIQAAAPEGVTHYFDNTGGPITDAVLMNARGNAKFALCGSISEYDDNWNGQKNYNMILMRRIRVTGFICTDHLDELPEATKEISELILAGKLKYKEDIREGLETYIESVRDLYTGGNKGKLMLKV